MQIARYILSQFLNLLDILRILDLHLKSLKMLLSVVGFLLLAVCRAQTVSQADDQPVDHSTLAICFLGLGEVCCYFRSQCWSIATNMIYADARLVLTQPNVYLVISTLMGEYSLIVLTLLDPRWTCAIRNLMVASADKAFWTSSRPRQILKMFATTLW